MLVLFASGVAILVLELRFSIIKLSRKVIDR